MNGIVKKYTLEITVFIGGAVVMILELVGSRILAPYVGSSIIVWTSLIGVILASLSLGYYWGGKLADKKHDYETLGNVLLLSSLFIIYIALFENPILSIITSYFSDIRIASFISAVILFVPATSVLGIISPYGVRLAAIKIEKTGTVAGRLYAISTLGSILGTFVSGFFLLGFLGSTKIVILLSILSAASSIIVFSNTKKRRMIFLLVLLSILELLLVFSWDQKGTGIVFDKDSSYSRIVVRKAIEEASGRPTLELTTGRVRQSGVFAEGEDDLVYEYTKYYRLADYFNPKIGRALMIGGGGYSVPKDFLKRNPDSLMDVVEIDPEVTLTAKKYFRLMEDSRMRIFAQDARDYINKNNELYDAIFIDAFSSDYAIPFHLTTKEFVSKMWETLEANGVVIMNIASSIEGPAGRFLRAEYLTYSSLFSRVYLFPVKDPLDGKKLQNVMLIALKSEGADLLSESTLKEEYLDHLWRRKIVKDVEILSDDFAPVEYYMLAAERWRI